MGLPRQSIPTGCLLGRPVAVTVGEAILDGVEAALVACRGRRQGLHSEGKGPEREEGPSHRAAQPPTLTRWPGGCEWEEAAPGHRGAGVLRWSKLGKALPPGCTCQQSLEGRDSGSSRPF